MGGSIVMRKIVALFYTVLISVIILNCTSLQVKDHHIQREWMLVSFEDFSKDQLIQSQAGINLTNQKNKGKIPGRAYMGCNQMFFNAEFKNSGSVEISKIGGNMKACQNMDLENSFLKSFKNMKKYSVEGHFLILSDEKGNIMKFIAVDWD